MMHAHLKSQCGFTLVEMIVVIVITGIIGGMVAMFIRAPVQGYVDSARRAEMTDIADTSLRRLGRDLRTAVPNSVRVPAPAGSTYVEFMPTKDGGRYRVSATGGGGGCGAAGDDLNFAAADTCFEIVGSPITFAAGDQIVIGSTQSSGNPPYQLPTSATGVRRAYNGVVGAATAVVMTSTVALPVFAEQDGHRFEVVPNDQQAVTYACLNLGTDTNGDGTGTLTRYWGYGFNPIQIAPPLGGSNAILADKVSACSFVYNTSNARDSLVAISLTLTRSGENVSLYHEIHVNNIP
ncbi:prepilin-type N-terminal cleavage/methylation domain-containing protein [Sideroxydans sp. CL21]|uniref:PulJ/GspJ family protein n=1 Tax=Sideroxydans sp. CL21 TaxID=2600596 RepID=UPI0024BC27EC|nr:prepilin-type N-terminal cleavage/methylation domain-containing protein [Sideroxydans sp. CL21]